MFFLYAVTLCVLCITFIHLSSEAQTQEYKPRIDSRTHILPRPAIIPEPQITAQAREYHTHVSDEPTSQEKADRLFDGLQSYQMVIPEQTDGYGNFLGYRLHDNGSREKKRPKRSAEDHIRDIRLYYKVKAFGYDFHFNLTHNKRLIAHDFLVEYWGEDGAYLQHSEVRHCHYVGHSQVITHRAAFSNCYGLHGVFQTELEMYLLEPLWNHTNNVETEGHPHIVYKRSALILQQHADGCGVADKNTDDKSVNLINTPTFINITKLNDRPDSNISNSIPSYAHPRSGSQRYRRSTSIDRHVETLVVVDKRMVAYHGKRQIEPYILMIMNVVAKLYEDPSIGNSINIVVNRLILFTEDQPSELIINHHADRSLESFCQWQQHINTMASPKTPHHDNAVLLTRYDICTYKNEPCGTLGLAPVAGMCDPSRSCSINEDIGLASAFTIAHEIGHNFGMQHDGAGNPCGSPGHEPARIMAARLTKDTTPFLWSGCSRDYITNFLDSGRGECLENRPRHARNFDLSSDLPGQLHTAHQQCQMHYGSQSRNCKPKEVCTELWCLNRSQRCDTNSIPAAEGTQCSTPAVRQGWCYRGECIKMGYRPPSVDGSWGQWSVWGQCSRSCGGGVETSGRECDNPRPRHGGMYCFGERRRYRSCHMRECPGNSRDFRTVQCEKYNTVAFRGRYYIWVPFTGAQVNPCSLTCLATHYNFYTERAPKVVDGTRCYPDSLDICINGHCRIVGCDGVLGSNTAEDKCRVCGGDGSSCQTISDMVNKRLPVGAYHEVARIPKGAMNLNVTEMTYSKNYLAVKSEKDTFYINGAWTIDWPRKFHIAGTIVHYTRPSDRPESLRCRGPTNESIIIMVLLQEVNVGIYYEYSIPPIRNSSINNLSIQYYWQLSPWSKCSKSCAKGTSHATSQCTRRTDDVRVEDRHCLPRRRPRERIQLCNIHKCPPEWLAEDWRTCSRTCGGGIQTRRVHCVQKVDDDDHAVVNSGQCTHERPASKRRCVNKKCPPTWFADAWTPCIPRCGPGRRTRQIYCMTSDGRRYLDAVQCTGQKKPAQTASCTNRDCPAPTWVTGDWGKCNSPCGKGQQRRSVQCRTYSGEQSNACNRFTQPITDQQCETPCDDGDKITEEEEEEEEECVDTYSVAYCPLVVRFRFCNREYFRKICCDTCAKVGFTRQQFSFRELFH